MKINTSNDEITIYLNRYYTSKCDFLSLDSLEEYMNDLLAKIKKIYNIKLNGFYNIDVYIDTNYGVIVNLKKENIEYYDYFSDQIDTQVSIHNNSTFLFKIDDYFEIKDYLKNCNYSLYKYNNELYIKLNNKIDDIKLGNLLEYSKEICYDMDKIIKSHNLLFCNK